MRIGILADIHEEVGSLKQALELLRQEGANALVVLGDLFYGGQRVAETADLLAAAGASGVGATHALGLCHDPPSRFRPRYPGPVFKFLKRLGSRRKRDDGLF